MRFQRLRVVAFSTLTIFFASCSGGGNSDAIPATVQSQVAVSGQQSISAASMLADERLSASLHYVAHPLPPNFVPTAIMRNGRITGSFGKDAAVLHHGRIIDLGSFNGLSSTALFVNDLKEAVGTALEPGGSGASHALLFERGAIHELPPQTTGVDGPHVTNVATAISDTGAIYGHSDLVADLGFPETVKFSVNHPAVRLADSLGVGMGFIFDINRSGAFAYQRSFGDAPFLPLPATGSGVAYAYLFGQRGGGALAINDRGDVAGHIDPTNEPFDGPAVPTNPNWHAFVKRGASLTILPYLSGTTEMEATGLNNRDDAVGPVGCDWAFLICPASVFVYTDGKLFDAAKLLPSLFSTPVSIFPGLSDKGDFVIQKGSNYYRVGPTGDDD